MNVGRKRTPALCMYNILTTTTMETTKMCLLELTKADAMVLANVIRRTAKTYIVVQEFSEPEKEPKIIAQFNERWQAEHYAWHHEGRLWVYEMSK